MESFEQAWKVFKSYKIKAKNLLWTLCGKGLQKATKGITKCDRMVDCKVITKCNRVDYKKQFTLPLKYIRVTRFYMKSKNKKPIKSKLNMGTK